MKRLLRYNLFSLLFLLLLLEFCLKVFQSDYQYYERTYADKFSEKAIHYLDTNWVAPEPDLGWVCQQKAQLKFYQPRFFDVHYQINQEGFRMGKDLADLEKTDKKRILLLGDSFLFGLFLTNEKTISAQLKKRLNADYELITLAVPGWGIDQMYQAYQKYVQQIQPDQVWMLFIDDDLQRTVETFFWGATTKRAYKLDNEKLVFREPTHGRLNVIESWFVFNFQIVNRFYYYWHLRLAERLSKAILRELILDEKKANRALKIVRLPRREQVHDLVLQQYDLTDFFKKEEVEYRDFRNEIKDRNIDEINQLYLPNDDHLSEKGAMEVADFLFKNHF